MGTLSAVEILEGEFLGVRARLIDVAAALDRLDRAEGAAATADPRREKIHQALAALAEDRPGRTERLQILFSLPYQEGWQDGVL